MNNLNEMDILDRIDLILGESQAIVVTKVDHNKFDRKYGGIINTLLRNLNVRSLKYSSDELLASVISFVTKLDYQGIYN